MADPSSPYPEVPQVLRDSARKAAREAYDMRAAGLGEAVDAAITTAFRAGIAAGRAQAAADIRDYVRQWDATRYTGSYSKGLHDAARLAEGDPSKDPEPEVDHV